MLPKIDQPVYDLVLPTSKVKIKFRPYLVKEEKLLLMALEAGTHDDYLKAMRQVIQNCVLTNTNVEEWALLDLEWFFLQLRAKSVGEIIHNMFRCENMIDDKRCGGVIELDIDLTKIEVPEIKSDLKIMLTGSMGVMMKYPNFAALKKNIQDKTEYLEELMVCCVDFIFNGDDIYYTKDYSTEDLVKFFDSLTKTQYLKLEKFFEDLPTIKYETKLQCPKCGFEHNFKLEGYDSFFE